MFRASDTDTFELLSNAQNGHGPSAGLLARFKSFSNLHSAFESVPLNLESFHSREKDRDDLGAVEPVVHPGTRLQFDSNLDSLGLSTLN